MKKTFTSILAASLIGVTLNAATATTTNPYDAEFAKMNQYFNSLIDSHLNRSALNNINYPRTDIQDSKKEIIIKFDLAGVEKKNIKLSIDDQKILTLEGEKKESKEEKSKEYVKKEIYYGSFKKMIQLPENINEDALTTQFKNGILTVTIPKKATKQPKAKVIPIK
jgi:HSP20 family protein